MRTLTLRRPPPKVSVRFCVSWGPLALHTLYAAVYGVGSLLATSDAVRAAGESGGRAGRVEEVLLGPDRS